MCIVGTLSIEGLRERNIFMIPSKLCLGSSLQSLIITVLPAEIDQQSLFLKRINLLKATLAKLLLFSRLVQLQLS